MTEERDDEQRLFIGVGAAVGFALDAAAHIAAADVVVPAAPRTRATRPFMARVGSAASGARYRPLSRRGSARITRHRAITPVSGRSCFPIRARLFAAAGADVRYSREGG